MPLAVRFLLMNSSGTPSPPPPPDPISVNTDVVLILVALLCAAVSVAGLAFVASCACRRRSFLGGGEAQAPPDKGLKEKDLRAIPKVAYGSAATTGGAAECAICLAEFEAGDELRVLPQCGHVFHAGCVNTWLASHSSCPSCRRVLVVVSPPSR